MMCPSPYDILECLFSLKSGKSIGTSSSNLIGISIQTTNGVQLSTAQTSAQLLDNTAGDAMSTNNFAQGTVIIN